MISAMKMRYVQLPVINKENMYIHNNIYIAQNQATTVYNILITVIINGHYVLLIDTFIVFEGSWMSTTTLYL